jgi:hypothetical protein
MSNFKVVSSQGGYKAIIFEVEHIRDSDKYRLTLNVCEAEVIAWMFENVETRSELKCLTPIPVTPTFVAEHHTGIQLPNGKCINGDGDIFCTFEELVLDYFDGKDHKILDKEEYQNMFIGMQYA